MKNSDFITFKFFIKKHLNELLEIKNLVKYTGYEKFNIYELPL